MSPIVQPKRRSPYWFAAALVGAAALTGYLATWIVVPAPLPGNVVVPSLRGIGKAEASEQLTALGLRLRLGEEIADPNIAVDLVSWQTPAANTQLPKGSAVIVGMSKGVPGVVVPVLENFDLSLATRVLAAAGLKIGKVDSADAPGEAGMVIASVPEGGNVARAGAAVAVTLSRGAMMVVVPDLGGQTIREARNHLAAAGLRAGQFSIKPGGRTGTVLSQEPAAGTTVPKASRIDITISGVTP